MIYRCGISPGNWTVDGCSSGRKTPFDIRNVKCDLFHNRRIRWTKKGEDQPASFRRIPGEADLIFYTVATADQKNIRKQFRRRFILRTTAEMELLPTSYFLLRHLRKCFRNNQISRHKFFSPSKMNHRQKRDFGPEYGAGILWPK